MRKVIRVQCPATYTEETIEFQNFIDPPINQ